MSRLVRMSRMVNPPAQYPGPQALSPVKALGERIRGGVL